MTDQSAQDQSQRSAGSQDQQNTSASVQPTVRSTPAQADQSQAAAVQPQPLQPYPPLSKEEKEAIGSLYKEAGPTGVVEQKEFKPPAEVKEWVTEVKKEEAIKLPVPVEDEYGAILMESARPSKPKIVLPLDDQGIKQGLKKRVVESFRWLVEWCMRVIKMFPGRVAYQKPQAGTKQQTSLPAGRQGTNNQNTNDQKVQPT